MAVQLSWQLILLAILYGQRNVTASSMQMARIVNGFNATAKQFPYQVYFDIHSNFKWKPSCGGTIISERFILTAAHCVDKEFLAIRIYFGAVDKSNNEEEGQQRLIVDHKNIIVHEEWDRDQSINDIALIRLPADLQFNEYIQPAELPDLVEVYDNQMAVASGWGAINVTSNNTAIRTQHLNYFSGEIMSNEKCKRLFHQNWLENEQTFFPSSYICLDLKENSACAGDSGGPLVVKNEAGGNTLVGSVSYGFDTSVCTPGQPNIFTRVSKYLNWIRHSQRKLNLKH